MSISHVWTVLLFIPLRNCVLVYWKPNAADKIKIRLSTWHLIGAWGKIMHVELQSCCPSIYHNKLAAVRGANASLSSRRAKPRSSHNLEAKPKTFNSLGGGKAKKLTTRGWKAGGVVLIPNSWRYMLSYLPVVTSMTSYITFDIDLFFLSVYKRASF